MLNQHITPSTKESMLRWLYFLESVALAKIWEFELITAIPIFKIFSIIPEVSIFAISSAYDDWTIDLLVDYILLPIQWQWLSEWWGILIFSARLTDNLGAIQNYLHFH